MRWVVRRTCSAVWATVQALGAVLEGMVTEVKVRGLGKKGSEG